MVASGPRARPRADEVLVERGGQRGLGGCVRRRCDGRARPRLDDDLVLEGEAYELIHRVNSLRKEQGFELTDRIVLTVPEEMSPLVRLTGAGRERGARPGRSARSSGCEELGGGALGAAQLDGQLEAHVLVHGRLLGHLGAALGEPGADRPRRAAPARTLPR